LGWIQDFRGLREFKLQTTEGGAVKGVLGHPCPENFKIEVLGVWKDPFPWTSFLPEPQQPKEPPSEAPCPYRNEKETHELIFSWLSWLAVLLMGAYSQR